MHEPSPTVDESSAPATMVPVDFGTVELFAFPEANRHVVTEDDALRCSADSGTPIQPDQGSTVNQKEGQTTAVPAPADPNGEICVAPGTMVFTPDIDTFLLTPMSQGLASATTLEEPARAQGRDWVVMGGSVSRSVGSSRSASDDIKVQILAPGGETTRVNVDVYGTVSYPAQGGGLRPFPGSLLCTYDMVLSGRAQGWVIVSSQEIATCDELLSRGANRVEYDAATRFDPDVYLRIESEFPVVVSATQLRVLIDSRLEPATRSWYWTLDSYSV